MNSPSLPHHLKGGMVVTWHRAFHPLKVRQPLVKIICRFFIGDLSQRALHKVIIPKVIRRPCKKRHVTRGQYFPTRSFNSSAAAQFLFATLPAARKFLILGTGHLSLPADLTLGAEVYSCYKHQLRETSLIAWRGGIHTT